MKLHKAIYPCGAWVEVDSTCLEFRRCFRGYPVDIMTNIAARCDGSDIHSKRAEKIIKLYWKLVYRVQYRNWSGVEA